HEPVGALSAAPEPPEADRRGSAEEAEPRARLQPAARRLSAFTGLSPSVHRRSAHTASGGPDTRCDPDRKGEIRPMKRTLTIAAAALAAALTAAVSAGARGSDTTIVGAGSSFVAPLVSAWQADYGSKTGVSVAYSPIGSGGGIAAITARQV